MSNKLQKSLKSQFCHLFFFLMFLFPITWLGLNYIHSTWEERSIHSTLPESWIVTDFTPPSTTFFAISMPKPRIPETSTFEWAIFRMASCPRTYLQKNLLLWIQKNFVKLYEIKFIVQLQKNTGKYIVCTYSWRE